MEMLDHIPKLCKGYEVVVAANLNGVIGRNGKIPWKSPKDFTHFKKLTIGHTIVMGRKTFESLGKRLFDRYHIVVSNNIAYKNKKFRPDLVVTDIDEPLYIKKGPLFLIGGAKVIKEALDKDLVHKIHLTTVFDVSTGDVIMPKIPEHFKLVESSDHFDVFPELRFQVFERV